MSAFALVCYGALRMPLALLELPLFVVLPALYGSAGLALSLVGGVLFGARCIDAAADPWIGLWLARQRCFVHRRWILVSLPILAAGFWALLHPPGAAVGPNLALWLGLWSIATYVAYSLASIAYQAWGTDLGENAASRTRVTAWREGFGLAGVLVATAFLDPTQRDALGITFLSTTIVAGLLLLRATPAPMRPSASPGRWVRVRSNPAFLRLLVIFVTNGVAAAIPATLLLFFVRDVLHAEEVTPVFLATYFLAGALGMPIWVVVARQIGLRLAWLAGMGLSVAGFAWALGLGSGDVWAFGAVCFVTVFALGADLAIPGALLAQVIADHGDRGPASGAYVGFWNLATKATLAIAAGVALPLLDLSGYQPGQPGGEIALSLVYAAVPCGLKLLACAMLGLMPPEPQVVLVRQTHVA
jgi:GPH family glycoside/pentoside/hexuronide:cation symporter